MREVRSAVFFCVLLCLGLIMGLSLGRSADLKKEMSARSAGEVLPSGILRLTSLEFDGIASDFFQLRSMVFFGELLQKEIPPSRSEWEWLHGNLRNSIELDPYFYDPYLFGNSILTWDAKMVEEANDLLEKGMTSRSWDYTLPFYLGFNCFYFLKDDERAAGYLMESARRPGATPLVTALVTRLQYRGNRSETAIGFLSEIIRKTEDPSAKHDLELRLMTLQQILFLERQVDIYMAKHAGKRPDSILELKISGLIKDVPRDPYGGVFYLDNDGKIKTTSEMRTQRRSHP